MYNLEVGQWHNFLVGCSGVVAHNGPCLNLAAEEALGGHSVLRHSPSRTINEMEARIFGLHPQLPQSNKAYRFLSSEVQENAINNAYNHYFTEIEAHFASGGKTKGWTFTHSQETGNGYINLGTKDAVILSEIQTTSEVTIVFKPSTSSPKGYYLLTAHPGTP